MIDERDPRKCAHCLPFFSLNPARTACVSCSQPDLPDGCLTCAVDKHNMTTECTSCIDNLELEEGECEFEGCEEDMV